MNQKEGTYQNIIDAAIALFAWNGFDATSLTDIVREANVSKGALYHYFSSKDELIETVFKRCHQAYEDAVCAGLDALPTTLDKLHVRARNLVAYTVEHPQETKINGMYMSQPRFKEQYNEGYRSFSHYQNALKLVTEGIENGTLKQMSPELMAEVYWHLCAGVYSYALNSPACIEDEAFWQTVDQVITDALAARP